MDQIIFEGVRCFHDFNTCPIKPITLLVGENSTGKTTFLALTRIAWDIIEGNSDKDLFNEEPFLLGSYDQVASFRGGRAGRVKSFMIGMQLDINQNSNQKALFGINSKITANFIQLGSESVLDEWCYKTDKYYLKIKARHISKENPFEITIQTLQGSLLFPPLPYYLTDKEHPLNSLNFILSKDFLNAEQKSNIVVSEKDTLTLSKMANEYSQSLGQRPYAFAPIRTKPKRTYDPLKTVYDPEGSHVPMLLNKILTDESKEGELLRKALGFFGETSGLFKKIEVKRKGDKNSDPFQIGVKTTGPSFNLIDVGYGVSQALPIIVDIILNPDGSTFLLQQPEVHLHPRAQAGLGSFLVYTAKEQNKKFVIETHSDYLIDRIRMDVRDKKYLNPDDIAILYFENSQGNVKIHELGLDEYGNIIDAPSTYRQFFLEEERRILGI